MDISPMANGSMTMSLATCATLLQDAKMSNEVEVAVLSKALDLQEEITTDLLQALDVGQNIDIIV